MTRALNLVAAVGLTVLAVSPATAGAQAPAQSKAQATTSPATLQPQMPRADERPISVDYYNVPLRDAVGRLARFSGRTIVMDAKFGNPIINGSYGNIHWRRALDLVLEEQGLVAKDDKSGIIKIEKRQR